MKIELDPPIIAAIITGVVAAVGLLIQSFLSISKNTYEKKTNFEKILIDKLEKIYSPLHMAFNITVEQEYLINAQVEELVNKYGHLLSGNLFNDIKELIKIEKNQQKVIKYFPKSEASIEYPVLREKVVEITKKEFSELQNIHDKNFNTHKKHTTISLSDKIGSTVKKLCIGISLIVYLFLMFLWLFKSKTPEEVVITIFSVILLLVICTTIIGLGYAISFFIENFMIIFGRDKRHFYESDYVPETAEYMCKKCGRVERKIKYTTFSYCTYQHNTLQTIKGICLNYRWKTAPEKNHKESIIQGSLEKG